MLNNRTVTNSISQNINNHAVQTITPDYTGIYAFCGTIIFLAIILYTVIYKISENWRLTYFKLKQEFAINYTVEQLLSTYVQQFHYFCISFPVVSACMQHH